MIQNNIPTTDWRKLTSRLIKSEMTKRNIKYEDLSKRLEQLGTQQTAPNLRNKINRGILGADLFIQILVALNVSQISQDNIQEILESIKHE